jgi:hypothetical protein
MIMSKRIAASGPTETNNFTDKRPRKTSGKTLRLHAHRTARSNSHHSYLDWATSSRGPKST